jgi:uncharacterized protein
MATNAMVEPASRAKAPSAVGQLSIPALIGLHLIPGALMTAAFVALAPLVATTGFPPIAALLVAIVFVLVPFELGVVLWAGRGERGVLGAVTYKQPLPGRTWLWLVPALVLLAFVGFGVHQVIEPGLISRFFGWLPGWFVKPIDPDHVREYATSAWVVTIAAFFAINGLLGPIVEELYFRGFLLPRMERLGRWAALVNVSLFSLYHLWSPWQLVARILGFGPTVYAVRRTRNVYVGMVVHCGLNTLAVLLVAMMVAGRL